MLVLTRILPNTLSKIAINPEAIIWMQPIGAPPDFKGTTLYMSAGPEVEVREKLEDLLRFFQIDKTLPPSKPSTE